MTERKRSFSSFRKRISALFGRKITFPLFPPGIYPCPCCGCRTFHVPKEDAIAYICPVCMWENDVFTASDNEPSDENRGMTLEQGRENYRNFAVCDPRLAQYARPPRPEELPPSGA